MAVLKKPGNRPSFTARILILAGMAQETMWVQKTKKHFMGGKESEHVSAEEA